MGVMTVHAHPLHGRDSAQQRLHSARLLLLLQVRGQQHHHSQQPHDHHRHRVHALQQTLSPQLVLHRVHLLRLLRRPARHGLVDAVVFGGHARQRHQHHLLHGGLLALTGGGDDELLRLLLLHQVVDHARHGASIHGVLVAALSTPQATHTPSLNGVAHI